MARPPTRTAILPAYEEAGKFSLELPGPILALKTIKNREIELAVHSVEAVPDSDVLLDQTFGKVHLDHIVVMIILGVDVENR
jgi:hypothetical protein